MNKSKKPASAAPVKPPIDLTAAEARIVEAIHARIGDKLTTASKWFWASLGAALSAAMLAGIGQITSLVIAKCFK